MVVGVLVVVVVVVVVMVMVMVVMVMVVGWLMCLLRCWLMVRYGVGLVVQQVVLQTLYPQKEVLQIGNRNRGRRLT
jgi:hypothetical protein